MIFVSFHPEVDQGPTLVRILYNGLDILVSFFFLSGP